MQRNRSCAFNVSLEAFDDEGIKRKRSKKYEN